MFLNARSTFEPFGSDEWAQPVVRSIASGKIMVMGPTVTSV